MRIAVFGATGYAGGHIADEAQRRGHAVVAVSRHPSPDSPPGRTGRAGSLFDTATLDAVAAEVDVVAVAVPAVSLAEFVPALLETVGRHGARVAVVGGAGSLLVSPQGPALYDTPDFPEAYRAGSQAHGAVLAALRAHPGGADWFYLSPAGTFGKHRPGARTGHYRTADDELITDADGVSSISGADYAIAFVDEIEDAKHLRSRFTVAY